MMATRHRRLAVEVFVLVNLSFLALDIFIAHSMNSFRHPAEWIPFYFSLGAPLLLLVALLSRRDGAQRWVGMWVGWAAIAVGIGGLLFHLSSRFFEQQTIKSLVYSAPFVAPLAYTGVGFLLLLNRLAVSEERERGRWLIVLALGGFVGNFVLALCDHAQNGFFAAAEWIPVVSAAAAIGFLSTALRAGCSRRFLNICLVVMGVQILVGMLGFCFHALAVYHGPGDLFDNIVYVAPVLAPLLFANLALLAAFGLWDVRGRSVGG